MRGAKEACLGEKDKDIALLRDAVERHREVVELSVRTERPLEDAGPLSNLAGSLIALAEAQQNGDRGRSYEEARDILIHLIAIYQQDGNELAAIDARENVAKIDNALGTLKD